jgi:hypothetical protein
MPSTYIDDWGLSTNVDDVFRSSIYDLPRPVVSIVEKGGDRDPSGPPI